MLFLSFFRCVCMLLWNLISFRLGWICDSCVWWCRDEVLIIVFLGSFEMDLYFREINVLCIFLCGKNIFKIRFFGCIVGMFLVECIVMLIFLCSIVFLIFLVNRFLLLIFFKGWFVLIIWWLLLVVWMIMILKVLVFRLCVVISWFCVLCVCVKVRGDLWVLIFNGVLEEGSLIVMVVFLFVFYCFDKCCCIWYFVVGVRFN